MARKCLFPKVSGLAVLLTLAVSAALGDGQPAKFMAKGSVESSAKNVLANTAGLNVGTPVAANVPQSDNPKVQPGLVSWHPTMAEACAVGRRTGKPVLLFQLMGNLNEKFC
jgi:hypothetical protein